jgi:hypothetical protein
MTRAVLRCLAAALACCAVVPAASHAQAAAPGSSRPPAAVDSTPAPASDAQAAEATVFAATVHPLAVGDTVRLVSTAGRYAGTLARVSPDTFTLAAPGRLDAVVRAEVSEMHRLVSREPRGRAILRGAGLGLVAGAVLGFVGGTSAGGGDATAKAAFTADGAIVGALIGAMMGPTWRRSHWERVDAAPPPR